MSVRVFVGARAVDAVPADDRGLAYGDGLFETMRAHRGDVPWWPAHWARLAAGAARLRLPLPDEAQVRAEARALLEGESGVLKLLVTRGSGGRGYMPPTKAIPTWLLSRHPLPVVPKTGLVLRWCDTRLAVQPLLGGLKHCNRLEQVMARAEWQAGGTESPSAPVVGYASRHGDAMTVRPQVADEGLMRSTEGDVVCATAANVFILRGNRWLTPAVDRCGIAGVCRRWAMDATGATEARLDVTDVEAADAVFLCNVVRGILPVARLGERTWAPHPLVVALQQRLAAEHPAFAPEYS
ncbi:aminotransferase class IV [Aerolutibacter daejeonensis]|uniref:aminotransferase class IV n=1 Tax=Aerolutibacter daejeonensis TaxID=346181 RepID=UPI00068E0D10|nr:aminotransferase class IV [Lysobacter daejeonensis]